jgi:hypothetical protein
VAGYDTEKCSSKDNELKLPKKTEGKEWLTGHASVVKYLALARHFLAAAKRRREKKASSDPVS